jgi:hypothetical protein
MLVRSDAQRGIDRQRMTQSDMTQSDMTQSDQ